MKLTIIFALAAAAVVADNLIPEPRILNGHPARKGEAPYIVSLKRESHFCGGSIIDEHWVLTAAHCLKNATSFQVVAGLYQRTDESNAQIRNVSNKAFRIVHEKYGGGAAPNDIALIYIAKPFYFQNKSSNEFTSVAKVKLPGGVITEYGKGKLYGWGFINHGIKPNTLQTLDTNILSYTQCKAALPTYAPLDTLSICSYNAGTPDGFCGGDSGGPLVRNTDSDTEIVGIVSWRPGCIKKLPSVYTRVSSYKDWIQNKINNFNPSKLSNLTAAD